MRVAVPDDKAAFALKEIVEFSALPVVADIHFHYKLALEAIKAGVAKVRINPGNIGSIDRVKAVVNAAGNAGIPIRVGVNSGSMPDHILDRDNHKVTPQGMVDAAFEEIKVLEKEGFKDIVVAMKASNIDTMVNANRIFRSQSNIPLHLGVTEAGLPGYGTIKSAIGIGSLLVDGIGETIRVSLTTAPENEIEVCWHILESIGVRRRSPELVSCPTCGRIEIDLFEMVEKVRKDLINMEIPIKVAVMGCVVNGPGEARDADIALIGGKGRGLILSKGEIIHSVPEKDLYTKFKEELEKQVLEYRISVNKK